MPRRNVSHYDIIVVGGGAIGLAAAAAGARRGHSVLVLEQFDMLHDRGSSTGAERQWRVQSAREELAQLALEAAPLWTELEKAGDRRLIHRTGSLWLGDTSVSTRDGQMQAAARLLDRLGLKYEWLTALEIERRYQFGNLPASYEGLVQPDGGVIDVRATLSLLYERARTHGAVLRDREPVRVLDPGPSGVTVHTEHADYHAEHVIIAAGPFTAGLLVPLGVELDIELYEMTTMYFRAVDSDYPTWFAFQQPTAEDANLFYGFGRLPWLGNDLVRVSPAFETNILEDAYRSSHTADLRQVRRTAEFVAAHLPGLDPRPLHPGHCLIALPGDPERQFYIGHPPAGVPGAERMVVCAAGWSFKYAPLLGRACVELAVDGQTRYGLSTFGF